MKVIIMGCGRVGEQLARTLTDEGHEISIIDKEEAALERLGPFFKGQRIRGIGFDQDVLLKAGIEQAGAFAATSASDNANIIAARIARNIFQVPRVVARLYAPHRAEIYRRLGLVTISSVDWGAERIRELLLHQELDPVFTFGRGEVALLKLELSAAFIGRAVKDLTVPGEIQVVAITRESAAFVPTMGTVFQAGDTVHLAVLATAMERLAMLGL